MWSIAIMHDGANFYCIIIGPMFMGWSSNTESTQSCLTVQIELFGVGKRGALSAISKQDQYATDSYAIQITIYTDYIRPNCSEEAELRTN